MPLDYKWQASLIVGYPSDRAGTKLVFLAERPC